MCDDQIVRWQVALVDYQLTYMLERGALRLGSKEVELNKYVQPASIDLPISGTVYLVKEKVLPFRKQVRQLLEELVLENKDLGDKGAVLLKGQTYLVYCGNVRLPAGCRGCLSPKSSVGRVDCMVRGVVDGCGLYDVIPGDGQERELWLEISPRSFNVRVHQGTAMTQLMLFMSPEDVHEADLPLLDATTIAAHHVSVAGGNFSQQRPSSPDGSSEQQAEQLRHAKNASVTMINRSFDEGSSWCEDGEDIAVSDEETDAGDASWQQELEARM